MSQQEKFNRLLQKYPQDRPAFFERPHWTRRRFFQLAGTGISGSFLAHRYVEAAEGWSARATPKNTARNVIFILLAGAPSHTDTFDFKMVNGVTPAGFAPDTINGVLWPMGLLPKLGRQLSDFAIIRSMRSHALVHSLGQTWVQIGRSPAAAFSGIAPHIGSVVAIEKDRERKPGQKFPTFMALNSNNVRGPGYMPSKYGPFKITPEGGGIANSINPAGQERFQRRWDLLHSLDGNLRSNSPYGQPVDDYNEFYAAAQGLMYDPTVNKVLGYTSEDSVRYGNSVLGRACLVAYQILKADQGTRFIQITSADGWDMHTNIYGGNGLPSKGKLLDDAVSAMLTDLKASGLLEQTLVVMHGEFGRTVGPLTGGGGRDHYPQQFAFVAGGGVKGGTIIGSTNASGGDVAEYGWSRQRYVQAEDIEATIYSAMGIDWTYVRPDDPFHRGFEYTPSPQQDLWGPVHELWG
jgi:Protein of unknown function (DUF1501)